MTDGDNHLTDG